MTLEPAVRTAMLAAMPKLLAFAISLCRNRDQAEDLVQDTLLRACTKIKLFAPGTNMLAWLCTILKNQFISQCRGRRRPFEPIDDNADSVVSKPVQILHAQCHELWTALTKLEPRQRELLVMIAAAGFSYDEAARICGCPTGTIKSRVNRARAELSQLLSVRDSKDFEEDRVIANGSRAATRRQQRAHSTLRIAAPLPSYGNAGSIQTPTPPYRYATRSSAPSR
jgi:RNA polymerase sigma-70 factor, ECF subfamily